MWTHVIAKHINRFKQIGWLFHCRDALDKELYVVDCGSSFFEGVLEQLDAIQGQNPVDVAFKESRDCHVIQSRAGYAVAEAIVID